MSTFQLTVGSNYVIAIAMLGEAIGFKMTRQFSQLMRSKAKTNCTLNALFFSRFEQVTSNYYDSDWFIALFVPFVFGQSNYIGNGFSTVENRSLGASYLTNERNEFSTSPLRPNPCQTQSRKLARHIIRI